MKNLIYLSIGVCILIIFNSGCTKEFLNAKPSSAILEPTTLDDFQSLLESAYTTPSSPALPTLSADEYVYTTYSSYQSARTATERNAYIWAKDIFQGAIDGGDWASPYTNIFYSNSVLAGLEKVANNQTDPSRWKYLKSWAQFQRAYAYYELVDNFAPVYDAATANTDLGVPIKLNPSIDDIEPRATVEQTYDQILSDLNAAMPGLVNNIPINNREQPSKVAGHALFARIYLNMRKYDLAEAHADSALQIYNTLIDYNSVSLTASTPFTPENDELIFTKSTVVTYPSISALSNPFITISPSLLALYSSNDLRPRIFFKQTSTGTTIPKRNYVGTGLYPFTGLATDELYLIKAESAARRNDVKTALTYLNSLLVKRYATNTFTPVTGTNKSDVLNAILNERQKELVWRNLRWDDIKRLNKEGANISLNRLLNGQTFILPPNDPRYVFPIPDNEIRLSGIPQNSR